MSTFTRRKLLGATAAGAALLAAPSIPRAQATAVRWGEMLAPSHPQVQMVDRVAAEVKEKTSGRIDIQSFPNGQLGSGRDMMEAVSAGALHMTTDGAGALAALLPALSVIEAPYLWRDAAHMAKSVSSPQFKKMNDDLVARRQMRLASVTYYGKRHLTTGTKNVRSPADMNGFKLRVPPVDVFRAMAEAWGAVATPVNFNELYLALNQGAVDGQENPLPTIQSGKFFEVQKFLVLTEHIITPRLVIVNEGFYRGLRNADRDILETALANGAKWQDAELLKQEATLVDTLRAAGMTVVQPDVKAWREPVLAKVPARFAQVWGAGTFDALAAL
ncbi:MAG: DctP family TRAP transporter solute-binding subunit [Alphaproteobacteria bacterium]|nr:DctP family TRAP transporter solute-binding subunit [Alphaproteobacteria bacterium]